MNNDNMINEEENVETNDLDFSEKENEIDEFDNKFNDDVFTYSVDNNNIENDYDASENNKSFLYLLYFWLIKVIQKILVFLLLNLKWLRVQMIIIKSILIYYLLLMVEW